MAQTFSTIQVLKDGTVATLTLQDRRLVEAEHIQRLEREMVEAVRSADASGFVINFQKVEFLSSAVLGAVIAANAAAVERGVSLALCCLSADILRIFKMMRLDSRLTICKTLDEARAAAH